MSCVLAITGLWVLVLNLARAWYMVSEAVTVPPGELMRRTTALTEESFSMVSSCWTKSETLFSWGWRRPPVRALRSMPSISRMAILSLAKDLVDFWTVISSSSVEFETGVMRRLGKPQPVRTRIQSMAARRNAKPQVAGMMKFD